MGVGVVSDDARINGANDAVNIALVVNAKSRNLTGLNLNVDGDDVNFCFFCCPACVVLFFLPPPPPPSPPFSI